MKIEFKIVFGSDEKEKERKKKRKIERSQDGNPKKDIFH